MDVGPGIVPTSRTQTLGSSTGPKALKNQQCELIFFWFFSFRQKMTWTRQTSFPEWILSEGETETGRSRVSCLFGTREPVLTLGGILVNVGHDRFAIHCILQLRTIKSVLPLCIRSSNPPCPHHP